MNIFEKFEKESDKNSDYPPQKPDPGVLPEPTFWPLGMAFGILFILWGLIASTGLTITGFLVSAVSLAGWISDLKPGDI